MAIILELRGKYLASKTSAHKNREVAITGMFKRFENLILGNFWVFQW